MGPDQGPTEERGLHQGPSHTAQGDAAAAAAVNHANSTNQPVTTATDYPACPGHEPHGSGDEE